MTRRRTTLVTGASSGIGLEIARVAAASGDNVVLVARREELLDRHAGEFADTYGVAAWPVALDITSEGAAAALAGRVQELGLTLDMLVNNAGVGLTGPFVEQDADRALGMIALNVTSLVALTREFLPGMVERGRGQVLNVASTSAFQAGPGMAVYHASKAFVLSFSDGVGYELRGTGVTVTTLCPRMTESEFFEASAVKRTAVLERILADPRDVARAGYEGALAGRTVVIPGMANKVLAYGSSALPRRLVTAVTARVLSQA